MPQVRPQEVDIIDVVKGQLRDDQPSFAGCIGYEHGLKIDNRFQFLLLTPAAIGCRGYRSGGFIRYGHVQRIHNF